MKLLTLNGAVTKTGKLMEMNLLELSDIDAGVWALATLSKMEPGVSFGDIVTDPEGAAVQMGGWLTNLRRSIGRGTSDAIKVIGNVGGSAVRLVTDKKVRTGVMDYANFFKVGGAEGGALGMLKGIFSKFTKTGQRQELTPQEQQLMLANIGKEAKAGIGGISPKTLMMIGGGAIALVLVAMMMRKK